MPASQVMIIAGLMVYNNYAQDGLAVANYYKANRPGMSEVDTLAVPADTTEQTSFEKMISRIRTPLYEFIPNSPYPKKILYCYVSRPSFARSGEWLCHC